MAPREGTRRRRAKGQSLPMIALMIVVLVAMVGLSVDVGNTFQNERKAVSAANAASLAGMNAVIDNDGTQKNKLVFDNIINSLRANGIAISEDGVPVSGELLLNVTYIDPQGKPLGTLSSSNVGDNIPDNVGFVQVEIEGLVDTYFARVVGRPDLPISASAYAGRCTLGGGVYPLAVNNALLTTVGSGTSIRYEFKEPPLVDGVREGDWVRIQSGPYKGKTARKVYVHDGNLNPGDFAFLRWMEGQGQMGTDATTINELEASLTGTGNLAWGFEEADEPVLGESGGEADLPYPKNPGTLDEGDWVHGTAAWKDGGYDAPIAELIKNGTRLILPIYDLPNDEGNDAEFRVFAFGSFVVLSQTDATGGSATKPYLELVYLGPAARQTTACQISPVPAQDSDCCILQGNVNFDPVYKFIPSEVRPIQYVVVLDQSGSMSANFDGQCNAGGDSAPTVSNYYVDNSNPKRKFTPYGEPEKFWQCANGPQYDTNNDGKRDAVAPLGLRKTGTGQTYYWDPFDERRITVAKKALETLISLTNMQGNANYTTAYPEDQMALVYFTDVVEHDGNNETFSTWDPWMNKNFSSDPAVLTQKMWDRSTQGNKYRTQGGTNGAAALYRASLILNPTPNKIKHTNGNEYEYRKFVLFITDGVSNQFFDEEATKLRVDQSDWDSYTSDNGCSKTYADENKRNLIIEDADCQTTKYGGVYTTTFTTRAGSKKTVGMERPVTQAINVAKTHLHAANYSVFVLALSSLPSTGLGDGIPTPNSGFFREVPELIENEDGTTNVDDVIRDINGIAEAGRCETKVDPNTNKIPSTEFDQVKTVTGQVYLTWPNVGKVYVTHSVTGETYETFIIADTSGRLSYRFEGNNKVPPGLYSMTAELYYKHPSDPDGKNRVYEGFWNGNGTVDTLPVEVSNTSSEGGFIPTTRKNIDMRSVKDVCAGLN